MLSFGLIYNNNFLLLKISLYYFSHKKLLLKASPPNSNHIKQLLLSRVTNILCTRRNQ